MFTRLLTFAALATLQATAAENIGWTRTIDSNIDFTIFVDPPNSGFFEFGDEVNLFFSALIADQGGPAVIATHSESSLPSYRAGDYISVEYNFDHIFTDAILPIDQAWQWADYQIEVFGGDAVINADDATYQVNNNPSSNFSIIGNDSNSLTLNSQHPSGSGGNFNGSLSITGDYTGIRFTQMFNSDAQNSFFDSATSVGLTGINSTVALPEPSTGLLVMLGSLPLLRRRR